MADIEGDFGLDNGSEDDEQKSGILDKILGGYRVGGSDSGDSTSAAQPPMQAAENAPPPPATDSTPSNGVASRMMPSKVPAPVTQNKADVPPTSFDPAPPKIDMPPMDSTAAMAGMNK